MSHNVRKNVIEKKITKKLQLQYALDFAESLGTREISPLLRESAKLKELEICFHLKEKIKEIHKKTRLFRPYIL